MIVTEIKWHEMPKMFSIYLCTEKVYQYGGH